jgi:hypothetical protein
VSENDTVKDKLRFAKMHSNGPSGQTEAKSMTQERPERGLRNHWVGFPSGSQSSSGSSRVPSRVRRVRLPSGVRLEVGNRLGPLGVGSTQ